MNALLTFVLLGCGQPAVAPTPDPEPAREGDGLTIISVMGPLVPKEEGEKWGYASADGRTIAARFVAAEPFQGGIAWAVDESGPVWIDTTGKVLARSFLFDNGPDPFASGRTRIVEGEKMGFMDDKGNVVIAPRFTWVDPFEGAHATFCEGCALVSDGEHKRIEGGTWGVIDAKGEVVVPPAEADRAKALALVAR